MVKKAEYKFGTGRRKSSKAQVRVFKGTGKFINTKKPASVFSENELSYIMEPLKLLGLEKKYDVSYIISGGGTSSQLDAIRLGLSRAISKISEEASKTLKKENLLSRDPREKERKKPGLKRARKAPQWAKR